jgi:hypothetical protein
MDDHKLEIKITHDNSQKEVELDAMSIAVAKAFIILVNSLTRIVELTPGSRNAKISIKKGSAAVSVEGASVEIVEENYRQILEKQSSNKELVDEWRKIQNLFSKNGIQYEANFYTKSRKLSILDQLKNSKKLRTKRAEKPPVETNIEFLSGKLIAVGGKKPNIHIETLESIRATISCSEAKANKAKAFLYNTILLSVWKSGSSDSPKYDMCDSYFESQKPTYDDFAGFIFNLKNSANEIDSLKLIHYKCQEILKSQNYGVYRKFLKLFLTDKMDANVLKTLLIASRPFQENERISPIFQELNRLFDDKMRKV